MATFSPLPHFQTPSGGVKLHNELTINLTFSSYKFKQQLRVYLLVSGETSNAFVQLVKLDLDLMMPLDASLMELVDKAEPRVYFSHVSNLPV